jgi:hypothetical protein
MTNLGEVLKRVWGNRKLWAVSLTLTLPLDEAIIYFEIEVKWKLQLKIAEKNTKFLGHEV